VPKYDAFGREVGEDTLAGLGGDHNAVTGASATPADGWTEAQVSAAASFGATAPAEAPPATPPRPQMPRPKPTPVPGAGAGLPGSARVIRVRRRSGLGCLVGLVVLLAIAAAPIIAVVSFVDDAGDTFDEITGVIDSAPDIDSVVPDVPDPPAKPPTGLAGASMVSPANFGKGLKRIEQAGPGKVMFIRLSPDRVDLLAVKGSRQRNAQVNFEGELVRGPATASTTNLEGIAYSDIDRSAPARLVRGSAARFKVREKGINYLVLSPDSIGGGQRWIAYFKNGIYVEGDRNGKVVRRIS
jgi:hypothetical protein